MFVLEKGDEHVEGPRQGPATRPESGREEHGF